MGTGFPKADVTVTLTGEEWFIILGKLVDRDLSKKGMALYHEASRKLGKQLLEAQRSMKDKEGAH